MASYQPPDEQTAIFNSQNFTSSYTGEHDPTKMNFPNAQGTPTMPSINVSDGINSSLITPTGITNSGAYSINTTSNIPIVSSNALGNIAISNSTAITSGQNNIAVGKNALITNTAGGQNVAVGSGALQNMTAFNATAVGTSALQFATVNNTAFGSAAGNKITSGFNNTIMGFQSFGNATTSGNNVAIGGNAGTSVDATNIHSNCCFIGTNSDSVNTAAFSNSIALGASSIITASNQLMVGHTSNPVSVVLPVRHTLGLASPISSTLSIPTSSSTLNIVSINNGTAGQNGNQMVTTGNPPLLVGMYIAASGLALGVTITGGSGNNWTISISTQLGTITGSYFFLTYPLAITSISGTTMTISTSAFSPTLPVGTRIHGVGVSTGTTISGGSGTTYTVSNSQTVGAITGGYNSPFISINFPLSEIYYITPQTTSITITLPNIASFNVGAKVTFRIVSPNTGSVILSSNAINIFTGTSVLPIQTHTIYPATTTTFASSGTTASISTTTLTLTGATPPTLTVGTLITGGTTLAGTIITAVLTATTYTVNNSQTSTPTSYTLPNLTSHTFMCLPTSIGGAAFANGWFQLGTV